MTSESSRWQASIALTCETLAMSPLLTPIMTPTTPMRASPTSWSLSNSKGVNRWSYARHQSNSMDKSWFRSLSVWYRIVPMWLIWCALELPADLVRLQWLVWLGVAPNCSDTTTIWSACALFSFCELRFQRLLEWLARIVLVYVLWPRLLALLAPLADIVAHIKLKQTLYLTR